MPKLFKAPMTVTVPRVGAADRADRQQRFMKETKVGKRSILKGGREKAREREISESGEIGAAGGAGLPYFIIQTVSVQVRLQLFFFYFFFLWRRLRPPFFFRGAQNLLLSALALWFQ